MEDQINCESGDNKSPSERLFDNNAKILIWIAIGFFVCSIVIYCVRFWGYEWGETEHFAQFGDFLGGTLNPLLSFITILLLVLSIRYQLEELRLTRFEIGKQLEEQQANNDIQLKIAELNEKSLILPALAESITRRSNAIEQFTALEIEQNISTLDSEKGVSRSLIVHKPRGAGDKTTLRELVSIYIDDDVADEIVIEKKLIPTFILFLSESSRTLQLLKDYLANGGSKYLAHDLGIEITKVCLLLKDCNDERLSGWAEKMSGQFHTFTRDYFDSIESNE